MSVPPASEVDHAVGPRFRLVVQGDGTIREVLLDTGHRWVIGRAPDCDIVLADPTASRHHLVLERLDGGLGFRDLGGTNVTLLNGRPAREGRVELGTSLLVGMTRLNVELARPSATVRVVDKTAVVFNRYAIEESREGRPHQPDQRVRLLSQLAATPVCAQQPEIIAAHMLELALEHSDQSVGTLGLFGSNGELQVLASLQLGSDRDDVAIPREILDDARSRPEPFVAEGGLSSGTPSRLVVPIGPGPDGALIIEASRPNDESIPATLAMLAEFGRLIWSRLHESRVLNELRDELEHLRASQPSAHEDLRRSQRLHATLETLDGLAGTSNPISLTGEDGCEFEALARYAHSNGDRADGPFVAIYAGVLPAERIAEELFGYDDKSTNRRREGGLTRARGGTLFIDRPDKLSSQELERLLREVTTTEGAPRLIGAVPHDSEQPIDAHRVGVPALRGYAEDILALANATLSQMGPGADGGPRRLTQPAAEQLVAHEWPTNTRGLQRAVETAAARAGSAPIEPKHLPPELREPPPSINRIRTLAEVEEEHIQNVLVACGQHKRRAAEALGIAASTLYERLRKAGIK